MADVNNPTEGACILVRSNSEGRLISGLTDQG
jgi:hypothetical protein